MVSNQQFRLKWNNHRNTVLQEFETLLHNNSFVDCTIGADGKYLKAHKIVLSACSPYLQNVFNEHFDKHPVILLKDVSFKELKCMIDYMYCGEVNISECELPSFLRTAQSLKIKGLAEDINDYDSASDNEPTEVNSFAENNRSVEANVEIHDDEPLTKKSAPSLISANIVNNSVTGRKRKIPNPVPICGKVSANSHNQTKNAGTATPNSSKSTDTSVSVPTSVAENESTERTTMNENSIIKNENTDTSNKKTTIQSESQDQKSRTEVKEEPVDTDADNEDNSSFECGNNDSDLLNEDSESGNKFGELSIASVSSFNENDANDESHLSKIKEEITSVEMIPEKDEPVEIGVEEFEGNETAFIRSEEIYVDPALQYISETDEEINNSIIVEVKSLSDEFDNSALFDENIETISSEECNVELATTRWNEDKNPSVLSFKKQSSRQYKEKNKYLMESDDEDRMPTKSTSKKRIRATSTNLDKNAQSAFRKILPASLKPAVQSRTLLPIPVPSSSIASATVNYPIPSKSTFRDNRMSVTDPSNPSTSYQLINLPGVQQYQEMSQGDLSQVVCSTEKDDGLNLNNVSSHQQSEVANVNPRFFVLNAGNPLALLNSNATCSTSRSSASFYKLSTPSTSSAALKIDRMQQISLRPIRKLSAKKLPAKQKPMNVTVTKNVDTSSTMRKFRKIAPLVKPPLEEYRCVKCFELFHNKQDAMKHVCSVSNNKKRTIAKVVKQYQ